CICPDFYPLPFCPCLSTAPRPPRLSTLSLPDALPISRVRIPGPLRLDYRTGFTQPRPDRFTGSLHWTGLVHLVSDYPTGPVHHRSEEHTSELQSRENLVCRLLLEKKQEQALNLQRPDP